jgi:hypothetical protein
VANPPKKGPGEAFSWFRDFESRREVAFESLVGFFRIDMVVYKENFMSVLLANVKQGQNEAVVINHYPHVHDFPSSGAWHSWSV